MVGKADYEPVSEGKGGLTGQRVELACRLFSHFGVITDQRGTSINQSGAGGITEY